MEGSSLVVNHDLLNPTPHKHVDNSDQANQSAVKRKRGHGKSWERMEVSARSESSREQYGLHILKIQCVQKRKSLKLIKFYNYY